MKKVASEADNTLNQMNDATSQLAALGIGQPVGWELMTPAEQLQYLQQVTGGLDKTNQVTQHVHDINKQKMDGLTQLKDVGVQTGVDAPLSVQPGKAASKKFNLKKYSQLSAQPQVDTALPQTDGSMPPTNDQPAPSTNGEINTSEVRGVLDSFAQGDGSNPEQAKAGAVDIAYATLAKFINNDQQSTDPQNNVQGDSTQTLKDALNTYYSAQEESDKDQSASLLARTFPNMFSLILGTNDNTPDDSNGEIPAVSQHGVKVDVSSFVKDTNETIKKLAQKDAKQSKQTKVFNLSKTAQHKSLNNVIMYDQDQVTTDQFTGQPISEWHLVERNKGFGLKLTNYWGADWEKVWRSTVMDKYDPLYIERRFEVDRSVPASNNIQLAPNEKRRFTPPEYGSTEARLEANRTEMNKERGYKPADDGKVFNWKKAQSQKKVKAQQNNQYSTNMLQPAELSSPTYLCPKCRNQLADDNGQPKTEGKDPNSGEGYVKCPQCGAQSSLRDVIHGPPKLGPDAAKTKAPSVSNVPIHSGSTNLDAQKLASEHGGIFFDSKDLKFIVYAGKNKKKKKEFDTYYEAEEFKMLVQDPSAVTVQTEQVPNLPKANQVPVVNDKQRTRPTKQQVQRQKEVHEHAHKLGIDG